MRQWLQNWLTNPRLEELSAAVMAAEARAQTERERAERAEERLHEMTRKTIDGLARQIGSRGFFDPTPEPEGEPYRQPVTQGFHQAQQLDREFEEVMRRQFSVPEAQ